VTTSTSAASDAWASGGINVFGSKASSGTSWIWPQGPRGSIAGDGGPFFDTAESGSWPPLPAAGANASSPAVPSCFLPLTSQPNTSRYSTARNFVGNQAPLSCSTMPQARRARKSHNPFAKYATGSTYGKRSWSTSSCDTAANVATTDAHSATAISACSVNCSQRVREKSTATMVIAMAPIVTQQPMATHGAPSCTPT